MEGVTILNTISNPIRGFAWTPLALVFALVVVGVVTVSFYCAFEEEDISFAIVGILLGLFLCLFVLVAGNSEVGSYNTYEVTISDEVSFSEFAKHYEIVDQRGSIFEVKERTE